MPFDKTLDVGSSWSDDNAAGSFLSTCPAHTLTRCGLDGRAVARSEGVNADTGRSLSVSVVDKDPADRSLSDWNGDDVSPDEVCARVDLSSLQD